jgi:hypothetical protein
MLRTKDIEIDKEKFTIGELNLEQTEEVTDQDPSSTEQKKIRTHAALAVCHGLNNGKDVQGPWTVEKVRKELGFGKFVKLQTEILVFSGLAAPSAAGEAKAATAKN